MNSERKNVVDCSDLQCVRFPLLSTITYKSIRDGISAGQVKPGEWLRRDALPRNWGEPGNGARGTDPVGLRRVGSACPS